MAFYGISTAGVTTTASTSNDSVQLGGITGLSGNAVYGLAGNDVINFGALGYTSTSIVTGIFAGSEETGTLSLSGAIYGRSSTTTFGTTVSFSGATTGSITAIATGVATVTSQQALRTFENTQVYGGDGNDSVYLGQSISTFNSASIDGGAGNDQIGNYTYVNQELTGGVAIAGDLNNDSVIGGAGNDTVRFYDEAGSIIVSANNIQGGADADSIFFKFLSGDIRNTIVAGGGGNDTVDFDSHSATSNTVAGGGGNDTVNWQVSVSDGVLYAGDQPAIEQGSFDGSDYLSGSISGGTGNTIMGAGGNDTMVLFLSGSTNNSIRGNAGNDSITIKNLLVSASIEAGAGNDSITISSNMSGSRIYGGGGSDSVTFTLTADSTRLNDLVVYGGADADIFVGTGTATIGITFGYTALSESTISGYDQINIGNGTGDTYTLQYNPGGLTRASDMSGTEGLVITNGIATFTGAVNSLTSRFDQLNSQVSTAGAVVGFQDQDNNYYTFVQGGGTNSDLLVRVGAARTAENFAITVASNTTGSEITLTT